MEEELLSALEVTMGLPLSCRYWLVLQVVAIVVCFRGKVSSEMVEGCVGSQLSLRCQEMKVIQITAVVLGDTYCGWPLSCCIRDNDCTRNANANHTMDVHRRCDGQSNCTVDVLQEKIDCGFVGWSNNDFERITYNCRDDPQNDNMMNSTDQRLTVDNRNPDSESADNSYEEPTTKPDNSHDTMNSTDQESTVDNRNTDSESAEKSHEEPTTTQDNSHYLTSTDGRLTNLYNNTKAGDQSDPGPATPASISQRAQGCVGSRLNLTCEEMKVIKITSVVLGDSDCSGTSCCIKDNDCTHNANEIHRRFVRRTCDNKQSCIVDVIKAGIDCGALGSWSNNDFERITYDCRDDPRTTTTSAHSRPDATAANSLASEYSAGSERTNDYLTSTDGTLTNLTNNTEVGPAKYESNSQALPVVMVIVGLVILLAIVVPVVVMYRRKKYAQVRFFDQVAMTEIDNHQDESDFNAHRTQGTSLHKNSMPLSVSQGDEADLPKTDEDPSIYCEVELKETVWNDGQSDRVTTNKTRAVIEAHTTVPDGVKGLVNNGDCFPDHSYSLMSHDMADINVNEPLVESYTRLLVEAVLKTPSPEDDEGLTVIENDLYSH